MAAVDLQLSFLAPVPVGQHVTLRAVERAVFYADGSTISRYEQLDEPLVRHDESGIVYCIPELVPWVNVREVVLVPPGGGYRSAGPSTHARVVACVVGSRGADEAAATQTRLVVEMAPPEPAYR